MQIMYVFINQFLQQATWLKGQNSMCIFAFGRVLESTQEEKTICALVERIHLIIVSREGNHAQFELLSKIFQPFNGMGYIFPHQSVYGHAKKGIMALLHFRTPLRVRVRATVSVKPRFFMMSHQ